MPTPSKKKHHTHNSLILGTFVNSPIKRNHIYDKKHTINYQGFFSTYRNGTTVNKNIRKRQNDITALYPI